MKIKNITFLLIVLCFFLCSVTITQGQTLVLRGGGMVIEGETFMVVQGDLIVRDEFTNGKINLDGSILLDKDIVNESQEGVFFMQEPIPNGWVVMRNSILEQKIKGQEPITFENLKLIGSKKTLMNTNSTTNGLLRLNSIFNLNSRTFIINNKESNALDYIGGYLYAETSPDEGYGILQWNIGSKIAAYSIPFGSGHSDTSDIGVTFQTIIAGTQSGNFLFSTYPTGNTNTPFPENVFCLNPYNAIQTADRFWLIDGDSYSQRPMSNITFRYLDSELENGNNMDKSSLKPIFFRHGAGLWDDYPIFQSDLLNRSMFVSNLSSSSIQKHWTLSANANSGDVFFPNAFTPDLDGKNELFMPVMGFTPLTFVMYIYDRWGNLLFTTTNPLIGWDGRFMNEDCVIDTYCWKAIMTKLDGKDYQYVGHVSIIK